MTLEEKLWLGSAVLAMWNGFSMVKNSMQLKLL